MISNRKFTLGAAERLKSRKVIERLFREGKSFALFPFKVFYLFSSPAPHLDSSPAPLLSSSPVGPSASHPAPHFDSPSASPPAPLQAGFAAGSRHFKKAVDRNRIKRLTKEAYRLQKNDLQTHLHATHRSLALFFIYTGKDLPQHSLISQKIAVILQKLIKEAGS